MSKLECKNVEPWLQDFVDGLLDPEQERRLRRHLAACAGCRRQERELRRLLIRVAELPREITPPRDLWPSVASRLEPRDPARLSDRVERPARVGAISSKRTPRRRPAHRRPAHRRPAHRWTRRQWTLQAAAAVVFMALGALLAHVSSPASVAVAPGEPAERSGRVGLASYSGIAAIEADYLRAKEALWLLAYSRHEELSPVKLDIVQRNLLIIDHAIRDLREALDEDPGNRQLETRLLAQHRRGIDLLQRLTRDGRRDRAMTEGA